MATHMYYWSWLVCLIAVIIWSLIDSREDTDAASSSPNGARLNILETKLATLDAKFEARMTKFEATVSKLESSVAEILLILNKLQTSSNDTERIRTSSNDTELVCKRS